MVAPFIGQNIGEDQKKGLRCKTSWFSVRKYRYVMTKKKRSLPANQWVFGLKGIKKPKWCHPKMVTTGAGRPPVPPLATPLRSENFGNCGQR